jgi:catechol 2,3-dioxygenase-like lactoylglutathione lyase family enzyme
MLGEHPVDVMLLATDLDLARRFYAGTLGLEVLLETGQFLTFRCGGDSRLVVTKSTTGTADTATKASWRVDDDDHPNERPLASWPVSAVFRPQLYWDTGTTQLLPRLLRLPDGTARASGPLFLASRRPVPARRPAPRDICPHTGRARLGYDRARVLFKKYTATATGDGLELHQLRHSAATHLGDQKVPLQLIMAKTRHKSPRTAMRYVKPGDAAVAEVTSLLGPPRRSH